MGHVIAVFCGSEVKYTGEEHITIYDSSPWAERGFCKRCGSGIFYRIKGNQQHHIPLGLFDNVDEIAFKHQVFIDKKPVYYSFSNETINMTEAEIFEKYGS